MHLNLCLVEITQVECVVICTCGRHYDRRFSLKSHSLRMGVRAHL